MHIKSIELENFRGVREFKAEGLNERVLCVGPNATGKSTILQAIALVLGGGYRVQHGHKLNHAEMVGPHGDEAKAHITIGIGQREIELQMTIKKGDGKTNRNLTLSSLFDKQIPETELSLGLNAHQAFDKPEIAELLTGQQQITEQQIVEAYPEFLDDLKQTRLADTGQDWDIEALKNLGETAYTLRRETKKRLKDHAEAAEVEQPTSKNGTPLTADDQTKLEENITRLRKERDQLLRASAYDPETAKQEAAKIRKELEQAREDRKLKDAEHRSAAEKLNKARDELKELRNKQSHNRGFIKHEQSKLQDLDKPIEDTCPECGQSLAEDIVAAMREQNEEKKAKAEQELARLEAEHKELDEQIERLQGDIPDLQAQLEHAQDNAGPVLQHCMLLEQKLAVADEELRNADPEAPQKIEKLDERIKAGEELLTQLRRWLDQQHARDKHAELSAELESLERLVAAFYHRKALDTLTTGESEILKRACEFLQRLGCGMTVMNGELAFRRNGEEHWRSIKHVSDSERVLCELAVAHAGCAPYGVPVLVDRVECVDAWAKMKLIQTVRESEGCIWMAAAWSMPDAPDLDQLQKHLDPITVIWTG